MIGLVDGDIIVFSAGFACERNVWHLVWDRGPDGEDGNTTWAECESFDYKKELDKRLDELFPGKYSREKGVDYDYFSERQLQPLSYALQNVKTMLKNIAEKCDLNPEFDLRIFLSPESGNTFRHDLAKSSVYKGNRKDSHRPTYEKDIREYLRKNYDCRVADYEEADDLLGIAATELGEEAILITIDKDLDMIAGNKYNWKHDVHYHVSPKEADKAFCLQLLSGDNTDNIPGLPKVGPATARKALNGLEDYEEMMAEVASQYMARAPVSDWYEYMVEQGRLIWIRRKPGEFWEPPEIAEALDGWANMKEEELTL